MDRALDDIIGERQVSDVLEMARFGKLLSTYSQLIAYQKGKQGGQNRRRNDWSRGGSRKVSTCLYSHI